MACLVGCQWLNDTWCQSAAIEFLHVVGRAEYRHFETRYPKIARRRSIDITYLCRFRREADLLRDHILSVERQDFGKERVRLEYGGVTRRATSDREKAGPTVKTDRHGVHFSPWAGDVFRGLNSDIIICYAVNRRDDEWLSSILADCLLPLMPVPIEGVAGRTIISVVRDHPSKPIARSAVGEDIVGMYKRVFGVDLETASAGDCEYGPS